MLSVKKIVRFLVDNHQKIRLALFNAYCIFIIYYTLQPRTVGDSHRADLRLMWAYREMLTGHPEWKEDVGYNVKNILFFIPFGLWFPEGFKPPSVFKDKRWLLILSAGMLFSVIIEITQYITCRGLCETDDVLCNGLGSLLGYWLFIALRKMWHEHRVDKNKFGKLDKELDE